MTEYNITYLIMRADMTEISLNTVDYQRVEVTAGWEGFLLYGDEGKSLYCYHIDSKEK